ncbi:MAG: lysylphosphatidylglycerol synthase transmembrane domain-containing protein [Anaerolineae bacterium]
MTRKQQVVVLIGLAISAVFLYFAFRKLHLQEALDILKAANLPLILFAAGWYFMAVLFISKRWQFLLRGIKRVRLPELFRLTCIGYMGNNVYPLRAGEILRIYLLQRNDQIPFAQGTVITFAERTFDGLVMLTFVVVSLALLQLPNESIRAVATVAAPLFLIALLVFLALAARPNWFRAIAHKVSGWLPGPLREVTLHLTDQILSSLQGLRTPALLAGTVAFSYLSWATEASVYWLVAMAMGIDTGYVSMLLVVGVVNLAGLIPASPGQLGVFEFFVTLVLSALGVADSLALAFALVVHVVIWLPVTLAGFVFLIRQGLGWNAITHASELEEKAAAS